MKKYQEMLMSAGTNPALLNPGINRELGYTIKERDELHLNGLLPNKQETIFDQVAREIRKFNKMITPLQKHMFLMQLLQRNRTLFYRFVLDNIYEVLPILYTPEIGEIAVEFSDLYQGSQMGLFISLNHKGKVEDIVNNWPENAVRVVVITDGERILGLGDLGANGMAIAYGKSLMYSVIAGIHPSEMLAISLDMGTNNSKLLHDNLYVGLQQKRASRYDDELVFELMHALTKRFGKHLVIQFEDFGKDNANRLLELTRDMYCTFNDDIQGTGAVILSGLITSLNVTSQFHGPKTLREHIFLFYGAGEAANGIANMIAKYIEKEETPVIRSGELSTDEAICQRIWMMDSKGLIYNGRKAGYAKHLTKFAHEWHGEIPKTLLETVQLIKPTCLIGVSSQQGAFTPEVCQEMIRNTNRPLIFALSNPTERSECTGNVAYLHTSGRALFVSGSPFQPVVLNSDRVDKTIVTTIEHSSQHKTVTFTPSQGNNLYIFPGVGLGLVASGARKVPDEVFIVAAESLSNQVMDEDLKHGSLYPKLEFLSAISANIAASVATYIYNADLATIYPQPPNLHELCRSLQYNPSYET